ncbi:hypothetical protein HFX_5209 (plasmid) [Haloferax mediterranei ATCC 33500]|uniref:Uncharacterized protein n=1 Tax=Haloferax mediterranei (strain ATCC 33500 / DSM 1411 / JCM 8866 / NBRC 14739 / NCIMB 2177 / R-4) TaxID=523841 RepID=I3R9Y1_HALMT|nr:hypothetical protein HFX_5209 [Haloferax mediterranei ATCC 33500]
MQELIGPVRSEIWVMSGRQWNERTDEQQQGRGCYTVPPLFPSARATRSVGHESQYDPTVLESTDGSG